MADWLNGWMARKGQKRKGMFAEETWFVGSGANQPISQTADKRLFSNLFFNLTFSHSFIHITSLFLYQVSLNRPVFSFFH